MKKEEHRRAYEMNRRQFIKLAGASGLATLSSSSLLGLGSLTPAHAEVVGKNAEERAIKAVLELKKKMKGDTLNLMVPAGGEGQFMMAQPWWEEATGIKVKYMIVPLAQLGSKAMNLAVTRSSKIDMIFINPYGIPDMVDGKLALDITDYVKKYNPELTGPNGVIEPLYLFAMYNGKLYGLTCDTDVNSLYVRRDWLEDADNQKAFEDKFGYPLRVPVLYKEYFDQIKFFTNPTKGTYGAWIYASPYYAKWEFLRLLTPKGVLPFDKDMNAQIAGPEGVEALRELIGQKDYLHPGCFTGGWDHAFKAYAEGKIWCTLTWPALIKYCNFPEYSKIVGNIKICPVPGNKLEDGTIFRPCQFTYGFSYSVSRYSKNPEIAYLYSQWMHSPTISSKIVPTTQGGFIDPYRYNHFTKELLEGYDPVHWEDVKEALMTNAANSYPEIQMKGGEEYMSELDRNVIAAFQGLKKPEEALRETAKVWEEITERFGREGQKKQWNFLTSCYGPSLRKAMNLPDPPAWVKTLG